MRRESLEFLKELLATPSPSSFEHRVQRVWLDYAKQFADQVFTDTYGNAVAFLNPGGSPKVIIVGHADEIGLMVQHVDEDGFIYAVGIGGVDAGAMPGQRVLIHGRKGPVHGVVLGHLMEEAKQRHALAPRCLA